MRRVDLISEGRVREGFLSVDQAVVRYELPGGTMSPPVKLEKLERGDSAAVLIHDPQRDQFLLVRQFRYPALSRGDPYLVEIVAGKIDPGEQPEDTARREAREELGVALGPLRRIAVFFPSPGTCSERIHLFAAELAEDSPEPKPHEGGGEDLELVRLSRAEAKRMLEAGELNDGKTLLALQTSKAVAP